MPTWNQIQSQLRHSNNPVVFIDVSVGTTVSTFPPPIQKVMFSYTEFSSDVTGEYVGGCEIIDNFLRTRQRDTAHQSLTTHLYYLCSQMDRK